MTADANNPGRVLVTGGASGLGAAVVEAVLKAGGTPVVLDRDISSVSGVKAFEVDVADRPAVEAAVREAADTVGGLDGVVTAAGIDRCGKLADVEATEWEKVIGVNLMGTVSVVRAALPYLKDTHGRVITVASTLGKRAVADATAYCASKFGVVGFSHALAAETGGEIGVTTIIPGGMKTRFFDDRTEQYKPQDDSRLNDPANTAQAILFALNQPRGCEIREMLICHEEEGSWP
ncbi:short-chain dehydrogenase/reductase SDR [Pseudarthrobacter chlorophenolicus A6]|uniref:Short-chain dehydrogenase/reductase SDR n=1 Tax=Pseudarthrobacter chlorophenolicus (strain ATCC 700700 / DSM 12829 / CIP 107037 / JCM 12360 / KCTC 9906 / NCIMB 13794 / A6) TaxID=452863 RepID=B8HB86_PSECP|nr:SDR family oxidoreductase [Pseudarthrobacter chlorophenolicus]ACL38571.1 short-chain dehydrogenase/reductase SDR [Pseudarthrobacter chlorophenolicus A6]SDQ46046.1 NADP-dependent 3-hydroxy acid dehydrogenase YdfG [Pseudarthrobacter chlorophenolicus]